MKLTIYSALAGAWFTLLMYSAWQLGIAMNGGAL